MTPREKSSASPRASLAPLLVVAPVAAALLIYSQLGAFAWDEGFHILAAQLIAAGKTPYTDFVFPQAPLNAFLTALAMKVFGETWRLTHAIEALASATAVFLVAGYTFRRVPDSRWRLPAAAAAALLAGLNVSVFEYGTVGQSYGVCLFLTMLAFRLAVRRSETPGPTRLGTAALSGLAAGAGAASSLLTAPLLLVLAAWFLLRKNVRALAAFLAAAILPFLPMLWLLIESPRRAWFNIAGFQLLYRRIEWSNWLTHDVGVDSAWASCPQALLLIGFAIAGLLLIRHSTYSAQLKAELYLAASMSAAETLYLLNIHPGFTRYYLLAVPFTAILSGFGLALIAQRVSNNTFPSAIRTWWPVAAIALVMSISLTRYVIDDRDDYSWQDFEAIGRRIDQVTPSGAPIYADEQAYFTARRLPPEGMSFNYSHKVELPPAEAATLGIVSRSELDKRIRAHAFATLETCDGDDEIKRLELKKIYRQRADIGNCSVFW